MKPIFILFAFSLTLIISCKSKENRALTENMNPGMIPNTGSYVETESDAPGYFKGIGENPNWEIIIKSLQPEIFEVNLYWNNGKETWLGLMKKFINEKSDDPGEFIIGELMNGSAKKTVEIYLESGECFNAANKLYNGRVAIFFDGQDYFGCGEYLK